MSSPTGKDAERAPDASSRSASEGAQLAPSPCNGHALRRASRRVSQLYDAVIAPCGLRSTQRSMLAQISRLDAPTMGELARALVLDRSALAHNIKPLERDGYLTITPDPQDKRTRRVSLTARGAAKLEQSIALWEDAQQRFEAVFGAEQAQELRRALALISSSRFVEAFEQADPDDYSGD